MYPRTFSVKISFSNEKLVRNISILSVFYRNNIRTDGLLILTGERINLFLRRRFDAFLQAILFCDTSISRCSEKSEKSQTSQYYTRIIIIVYGYTHTVYCYLFWTVHLFIVRMKKYFSTICESLKPPVRHFMPDSIARCISLYPPYQWIPIILRYGACFLVARSCGGSVDAGRRILVKKNSRRKCYLCATISLRYDGSVSFRSVRLHSDIHCQY